MESFGLQECICSNVKKIRGALGIRSLLFSRVPDGSLQARYERFLGVPATGGRDLAFCSKCKHMQNIQTNTKTKKEKTTTNTNICKTNTTNYETYYKSSFGFISWLTSRGCKMKAFFDMFGAILFACFALVLIYFHCLYMCLYVVLHAEIFNMFFICCFVFFVFVCSVFFYCLYACSQVFAFVCIFQFVSVIVFVLFV